MNKIEFEKKFMEIAKQKFDMRSNWENALRNMLKFFDDHKIYEYKPYENLLHSLRSITFVPNATKYLEDIVANGAFLTYSNQLFLKKKHYQRQNDSQTFIHELTHALSFERKIFFDCQKFKKETTPLISEGMYLCAEDHGDSEKFSDDEMAEIFRWLQTHDDIFPDAQTSRPVRVELSCGFRGTEIEYNEFLTSRKIHKNLKTVRDYLRFSNQRIGDMCFNCRQTKFSKLQGLNEGTTELISKLIGCQSAPDNTILLTAYASQVMICAQIYAIFGETLFEGFWTHSLAPMSKKMDVKEDFLENIFAPISDLKQSSNDKDRETKMQLVDDIQINVIKLFERKMLRELVKYKDYFSSSSAMRHAIISSFFDYSKLLFFGLYMEEVLNPNYDAVWKQLEKSLANCMNFGNKLLARRKMNAMRPLSSKNLEAMKNQNYFSYGYISKDLKEISCSNRIAPFEYNYVGPSDERREKDAMKIFKTDSFPGECSYALNNGIDQTALYCHALGEEIDEKLLQMDGEDLEA